MSNQIDTEKALEKMSTFMIKKKKPLSNLGLSNLGVIMDFYTKPRLANFVYQSENLISLRLKKQSKLYK